MLYFLTLALLAFAKDEEKCSHQIQKFSTCTHERGSLLQSRYCQEANSDSEGPWFTHEHECFDYCDKHLEDCIACVHNCIKRQYMPVTTCEEKNSTCGSHVVFYDEGERATFPSSEKGVVKNTQIGKYCTEASTDFEGPWFDSEDQCYDECEANKKCIACVYNCVKEKYAAAETCEETGSSCGSHILYYEKETEAPASSYTRGKFSKAVYGKKYKKVKSPEECELMCTADEAAALEYMDKQKKCNCITSFDKMRVSKKLIKEL